MDYPAPRPQKHGFGWRCRFTDRAGKRRWTPVMPSRCAAVQAALDQRAAQQTRGHDVTLGAALTLAYADLERHGRSVGTRRWLDGQAAVLRRFWRDETPLRHLDQTEVQRFVARRLREVSAATVRHQLRCIGRLQVLARRAGWQGTITARDVECPTPAPPAPRAMRWQRVEALIRRVRRESPADADLIELLARTGVRRAEAAALRREHVDLHRGLLHVAKAKRRPRTLPISEHLRPVLGRMLERLPADASEPLIRGGVETIARTFRRWRERLGEPRIGAHAMRHSLGTALVERGQSIAIVAKVLGHAPGSAQVTMRYLAHAEPELRRALDSV